MLLHREAHAKRPGSSGAELLRAIKSLVGRRCNNQKEIISNVHLLFPREREQQAAEEEGTTTATGPIRECQVQKIGLYDTEMGIKARPGVTHLLNRCNLLIAAPVCTLRRDINSELVMAKGNDGRLLD